MQRFQQNRLLALLVDGDLRQLVPEMKELDLEPGAVLFEADQPIDHVYFPLTGIVSLLATIGNEGVVGLGGLLAGDVSFSRQTVQLNGQAVGISREPFLAAVHQSRRMRRILAAHTDAFTSQLMQSAACNVRHDAEHRLARWLLTMADRSGQGSLPFTHQVVAEMLGVQRPTITLAARMLQTVGLIHWTRGSLAILDRSGLAAAACECYNIIRDAYDMALKADTGQK
jgi:CRP-like cAMP-binding protein